jgi:acetyl-CoA carboxylase biotin carboxyl carrier protein
MDKSPTTLGEIAEFVQQTAEQMRRFGLSAVDVDHNGTRIKVRISAAKQDVPRAQSPSLAEASEQEVSEPTVDETGFLVAAPMIGTFFAAAGPDEPIFVEVGDLVDSGQTIGIIEAMKIMNEITAEISGIVAEIYVKNAQAVEYGQRLMRIVPAE